MYIAWGPIALTLMLIAIVPIGYIDHFLLIRMARRSGRSSKGERPVYRCSTISNGAQVA